MALELFLILHACGLRKFWVLQVQSCCLTFEAISHGNTFSLLLISKAYFALPAFLAQASLQYFDLALNVVYGFLQTGHFFSIPNPAP